MPSSIHFAQPNAKSGREIQPNVVPKAQLTYLWLCYYATFLIYHVFSHCKMSAPEYHLRGRKLQQSSLSSTAAIQCTIIQIIGAMIQMARTPAYDSDEPVMTTVFQRGWRTWGWDNIEDGEGILADYEERNIDTDDNEDIFINSQISSYTAAGKRLEKL